MDNPVDSVAATNTTDGNNLLELDLMGDGGAP